MAGGPTWTTAEEDILLQPVTASEAQAKLMAEGYPYRNLKALEVHRFRIDPDPETRRLAQTLQRLAEHADKPRFYRTAYRSEALRQAMELDYARQVGKSTYRITLKGMAWLRGRNYGSN